MEKGDRTPDAEPPDVTEPFFESQAYRDFRLLLEDEQAYQREMRERARQSREEDDRYIAAHGLFAFARKTFVELWNNPQLSTTDRRERRKQMVFFFSLLLKFLIILFVLPLIILLGMLWQWLFGSNPVVAALHWTGSHLGWLIDWLFSDLIERN
jgi:hypothetical protein